MINNIAYLPAYIRYNKVLSSDTKLLYAELTAVTGIDGKCKLDIKHLCGVFMVNAQAVKGMLNILHQGGFIKKEGNNILMLTTLNTPKIQPYLEGVDSTFIDEVIIFWNKLFEKDNPRGIRRTPLLIKTLTERQLTFTKEEIMTALSNRHGFVNTSDWHMIDDNIKHKINIMLVLRDDDKLQDSLNYTPAKGNNMKRNTVAVKKEAGGLNLLE